MQNGIMLELWIYYIIYYKYGKISFQAKALFINRIIYNTNWMNIDK